MIDSRNPEGKSFTYDYNGHQYRARPVSQMVGKMEIPILVDTAVDYLVEQSTASGWKVVGYAIKNTLDKGEDFGWTWDAFYGTDKYLNTFEGIRACIARISIYRKENGIR